MCLAGDSASFYAAGTDPEDDIEPGAKSTLQTTARRTSGLAAQLTIFELSQHLLHDGQFLVAGNRRLA